MNYKIFSSHGAKKEVQIAACKTKGLSGCTRELDEVASRNRSGDLVHCTLQTLVLSQYK